MDIEDYACHSLLTIPLKLEGREKDNDFLEYATLAEHSFQYLICISYCLDNKNFTNSCHFCIKMAVSKARDLDMEYHKYQPLINC